MVLWVGDLEHFEAFCKTLRLTNGRPFVLEPFQRTILADYFRGARESLVLLPKKNGKTTLLAALVVYHLVYVDDAECYVAASSRDQATLLYNIAKGFVNRSPALQRRILVRAGTRELRSRRDEGFVKVLAADSETADGVGPTLAIVDELHRAKSLALYGVFADGIDARDGAMVTISTAGDDEDGPLGEMRSKYLALPGKRIRGRYTYCRSRDGSNVMHEWALRPTDNLEDLELVKQANPLRSMTKAKLKRRRDSASMTAQRWARFACNVWTQSDDAAIATLDWARKARQGLRLPGGSDVCIGVDLGWSQDTSAFVPVGHPWVDELELDEHGDPVAGVNRDEAWIDERLVCIPAGTQAGPGDAPGRIEEGRWTDEAVLKAAARRLAAIFPGARWAIDPNAGGQAFAQWIERELCGGDESRVFIYSQQPASMALASMHFAGGVRTWTVQEPGTPAGEDPDPDTDDVRTVPVYHPDDERLNGHVRGAVARWVGERWRFDKRKKPRAGSTKVHVRPVDLVIGSTLGYRGLMAPASTGLQPFVMVGR